MPEGYHHGRGQAKYNSFKRMIRAPGVSNDRDFGRAGFRRGLESPPCARGRAMRPPPPWPAARHIPGRTPWRRTALRHRPATDGTGAPRHLHRATPGQGTRTSVEELLQFVEGALRHLVDGKFAGIVSASGNESDQGLGLRYLVGIKATSRAQAWRSATPAPPASSPGGTLAAYPRHLQSGRPFRTTRTIIQRS
jgi:hypothetical protein